MYILNSSQAEIAHIGPRSFEVEAEFIKFDSPTHNKKFTALNVQSIEVDFTILSHRQRNIKVVVDGQTLTCNTK